MSQQLVAAEHTARHSVDLMLSERDFGVDTRKGQEAAVILPRTVGIELVVIQAAKALTARRVFPYPVGKRGFDKLLLALGDGGFLAVENGLLSSFCVLHIVEDTHITEIQGFLDDFIAVDPARAVGVVGFDVAPVVALALDVPFAGVLREVDMDIPS